MPLPERLGRLRQVRRIGSGGFATVWLYRDYELRSDVAVKALAENWAARLDVRERFLEEARILRAADSDHVVRVHDIGESDGVPWFVMTYADRGSLDAGLTGVPWSPRHVVPIVEQAAAGLAVLHSRGVVHRDVKPQNLLLRGDGVDSRPAQGDGPTPEVLASSRLMVADLGVAKALLHASGLTQVVGTPAYMAPEQATGEGLDARADVHALGAVAYHLLTGRILREGGFAELVEGRPPVPPSSLADLPRAVDDVVLRAVAARPDERWSDVQTFAARLTEALAQPVRSSGDTAVRPVAEPTPTVETPVPVAPDDVPRHLAPTPQEARRTSPLAATLLVLLALAGSFAAAYTVVLALR
ncbi:serine/threonine-protein kinase [Nocardioides sp. C4-1]|uniref:serine/threonine-protein kinase n=1 Tax=Nocardioides sp. C4-1 TaxID=3151851 RepID=UPI003266E386